MKQKSREIPEGDIESIENDIRDRREKIRFIRENTRNARIKARKEAEWMEEGRTGMLVGAGLGAIAGGALGSKFDK